MIGIATSLVTLVIFQTHAWGLLLLVVALVVIYTRALIRWRREDREFLETAP